MQSALHLNQILFFPLFFRNSGMSRQCHFFLYCEANPRRNNFNIMIIVVCQDPIIGPLFLDFKTHLIIPIFFASNYTVMNKHKKTSFLLVYLNENLLRSKIQVVFLIFNEKYCPLEYYGQFEPSV